MLSLLLASSIAQAAFTLDCKINEIVNEKATKSVVSHVIDENMSHSLTPIKTTVVNGFVANSRGYGVVNIVNNKTNQVMSFHGEIARGGVIGGKIHYPESNTWVEVDCQIAHK